MSSMKDLLADRPYQLPSPPASVAFDGVTYEPELDHARLNGQLKAVFDLMRDGQWRTLTQIQNFVAGSEAAISARLRDLRKEQYGGHEVERRRCDRQGLWEYRLQVRP